MQYAKLANWPPICICNRVRNFKQNCKGNFQLKCHFSQINEGDDINENQKSILQCLLVTTKHPVVTEAYMKYSNHSGN